MKKMFLVMVVASVLMIQMVIPGLAAEQFPTRPIKILVTHGPGSVMDLCTRLIAPYFQKYIGVGVVVENVPGAGGVIMRNQLYKEKPDGYTLGLTGIPGMHLRELVFNAAYKTMGFTYLYNFIGRDYDLIFVGKNSPYKSYKDLSEGSKSKQITIAISGLGGIDHLICILFRDKGKLNCKPIPFGGGDLMVSVLGKQVDCGVDSVSGASGRTDVRPLAILAPERLPFYPDVPVAKELGVTDFTFFNRNGIIGPPNMPVNIATKIEEGLKKAVADPAFVADTKKANLNIETLDSKAYRATSQALFDSIKEIVPVIQREMQGEKK